MATTTNRHVIRKLRKKLRQIDTLERLNRDLTEEEDEKISRKDDIREELQELLSNISDVDNSQSISAYSADGDVSTNIPNYERQEIFHITASSQKDSSENDLNDEVNTSNKLPAVSNASNGDGVQYRTVYLGQKRQEHNTGEGKDEHSPPISKQAKKDKSPKGQTVNKKEDEQLNTLKRQWKTSQFDVCELVGHNDNICAIDVLGKYAVTGSRDTTVKVWNLELHMEERSLGCHTGSVTTVVLLKKEEAKNIAEYHNEDTDWLLISGSYDCSIKIWNIHTGQPIQSIYTYNPVTCIAYMYDKSYIISGSDGGKLELWNSRTCDNIHSLRAHDEAISCIKLSDGMIYTASSGGIIAVYRFNEDRLQPVFVSENTHDDHGREPTQRPIYSMQVVDGLIYYGDDGINVKVLNWKTGTVCRIKNHLGEFGHTGSIWCNDNIMFTSGYDLDTGYSFINVRSTRDQEYLGTMDDGCTGHVMCMAGRESGHKSFQLITAGTELKVWKNLHRNHSSDQDYVIQMQYKEELRNTADASDPSGSSDGETSNTDTEFEPNSRRPSNRQPTESTGWYSWCSVL